jgi:hypothetical protein
MSKESPASALEDWAKEVLTWCDEEALPTPLGKAISFSLRDQESTPQRLLKIEKALLIFINPPEQEDAGWFLDAVAESTRPEPIVLVSTTVRHHAQFASWAPDRLDSTAQPEFLSEALRSNRTTLIALALLDLPLHDTALAAIGFSREQFPRGGPLTVETTLGPILPASVRSAVLAGAAREELSAGHEQCLQMLDAHAAMDSERLLRERLRHLIGADRREEALETAARLVQAYYFEDRYESIVDCFELLKPLAKARGNFDTLGLIRVVEAYVRVGKMKRAEFWLQKCKPEGLIQNAVVLSLKSEIAKNSGAEGWREKAIAFARDAIEECRKAQAIPELAAAASVLELEHTMSLARLQHYLNHDLAAAETEYRHVIAQAASCAVPPGLVAAAERNLAECLVARYPNNGIKLQEAQGLLADADDRLKGLPTEPLRAEIAYVQAKLQEGSSSIDSVALLYATCRQLASETGSGMVAAIADARLFRLREVFSIKRWYEIERALSPYRSHGWALRTIMNGRIYSAQKLAKSAEKEEALKLLRANLSDIELHPAYDRGSDRDRIALTLAGTITMANGADSERARELWTAAAWIPSWLASRQYASSSDAWEQG